MISFRYHIVSIIAIFLALALGIVVGTTALNGPITNDLRHQVDSLKKDRSALASQNRSLGNQANNADQFASVYGGQIVKGTLDGRSVIMISMPGAPGTMKDGVAKQLNAAGAKVTGRIQITNDYVDPKRSSDITALATGSVHPINLTLPNTDDAATLGGVLLSFVLVGKGEQSDLSQVLSGFSTLQMLKVEGKDVTPATAFVVVASGTLPPDAPAGHTEATLVSQLALAGGSVVVAGDNQSATGSGLVALVRTGSGSQRISTVDNADSAIGQVTTALALADVANGQNGDFGTAKGANQLFPDPSK